MAPPRRRWSPRPRIAHPGQPVTIGTALPGYVVYVLDDQMRPVDPGESGEIYIGGDSIARGYLNRPELTAERFIDNPLHQPRRRIGPAVPDQRPGRV